ncbi:MAG: hypothetical protein AB1899_14855 [Pseudomonadota bacterium]
MVIRSGIVALSMVVLLAPWSARADKQTLSTGLTYLTGKYGESYSTDVYYLPVVFKQEWKRSQCKATVPYLRIRTGNSPRTEEEGLGDILTSCTYSLIDKPWHGFLVDALGKVKWPTADERKSLGNGRVAYSLQADVYYLSGAVTPFATLGYKMPQDPPGSILRSVWYGTVGLAYKHSKTDSMGLLWDMQQASRVAGPGIGLDADGRPITGEDSMELTAYWVHKFNPQYKLQLYAIRGFSDASPDLGLGFMFSRVF